MSNSTSPNKMSLKEIVTRPTSITDGDTESSYSAPLMPGAPPPTRAPTIAAVPDYDYIQAKLSGLTVSTPPTSLPDGARLERVETHESEGVLEANNWAEVAEDVFVEGLKRIAMLAKDENQGDPSKSVEEYYSERLAKLIKAGEIKFDVQKLK